ncbi:MAG: nucleotidyltransferase family protein, partial [Victivallaceae bacterium]|nr:nucleotidyltransferase family protein [Victivallaceae bacterium]
MRPDEIGAAITLLGRAIRNELPDEATGEECRLAQEFGFAPLLFFRRRGRLPEPFATSLRGVYRARSQRMMPMGFALKEVEGVLDGAGVRYLPIKGAALLKMATYPDQALRAMCDLDFWVHPDDCGKAANQLKSSGWRVQQAIRNE